jgi:hypothetical protein
MRSAALFASVVLVLALAEAKLPEKDLFKKAAKDNLTEVPEGSADYNDEEEWDYKEDPIEGSGEEEEAVLIPDMTDAKNKKAPEFGVEKNTDDDIHFEESAKDDDDEYDDDDYYDKEENEIKDKKDKDLYEYYNEIYEQDYDDEDAKPKVTKDDGRTFVAAGDVVSKDEEHEQQAGANTFQLSYLYIMLASALVSFALALAAFFLCRSRSFGQRRNKKKQPPPFTVMPQTAQIRPSPIVKSYTKVPTTTREFMQAPPPPYRATTIDMGEKRRPLLLSERH